MFLNRELIPYCYILILLLLSLVLSVVVVRFGMLFVDNNWTTRNWTDFIISCLCVRLLYNGQHSAGLCLKTCLHREPDTSASRHSGTLRHYKIGAEVYDESLVELCLIGIVLGRSVPAFPRSRHSCRSVLYHVFGVKVS